MSTDRETTRIVRSWLEEGVTALPDRVLDTVLDQVPVTPRGSMPRRATSSGTCVLDVDGVRVVIRSDTYPGTSPKVQAELSAIVAPIEIEP